MTGMMAEDQITSMAIQSAPATPADNALELLEIELFFLLVGLFVIAVIGYLIWESWRKKKGK